MKKGVLILLAAGNAVYAGNPLWTFTPLTQTKVSIPSDNNAFVQYLVTNQSKKTQTLAMNPISGVTQDTYEGVCQNPFTLGSQESCILSLTITGRQLTGTISGGPVVCDEAGQGLQCYQPSPNDTLVLTVTKFLYVTNTLDGTVSRCDKNPNSGEISGCVTVASGFDQPYGIKFFNGYAYVSNYATVSKCIVNPVDGTLSGCSNTGSGFSGANQLNTRNFADQIYAYITNYNSNSVTKCIVNLSTGDLSNCSSTGSGFSAPYGLFYYRQFAYIANYNSNTISKCNMNPLTGDLSGCSSTGSGFSGPKSITLYGNIAYVANNLNNTVSRCFINAQTGLFTSCVLTGSGFTGPAGFTGINQYFYTANANDNTISMCTRNFSNELVLCSKTNSYFSLPQGRMDVY